MKGILKSLITTAIIIILIGLVMKLGVLDFFVLKVDDEKLENYSGYYFKQLELDEKKIYAQISEAVKTKKEKILVESHEFLTEKVSKVMMAYFYDNPEVYYLSNEYTLTTNNLKFITYSILKLNYIINVEDINIKTQELENYIDKILTECVTDNMTDFEKEVAIHDTLVKKTDYYKYIDINLIPGIKHTAYGALVEKSAVCDGYAKAFKILLDRVGIESIIISGDTEDVAHAWNVVNINNEYYHVDVTSDKLEDGSKKHVIHTYFNVNDKKISETHLLDNSFNYPKCDETKYEYYNQQGLVINSTDNLYNKLAITIKKQKNIEMFEIRISDRYSSKQIVDTLYDLNFNNWKANGKSSVTYRQVNDIYMFVAD